MRYRITLIWQPNWTTERDWIWPPSILNGLPNGATRDSRDNYQKRITEISQRRYHCRRTSHGDREDYREPYSTKPLTKMLTELRTEGSRNFRRTAYRTDCETTLPAAYQLTTDRSCGEKKGWHKVRLCWAHGPERGTCVSTQLHGSAEKIDIARLD
jgi:hypothetical protein